MAAKIINSVLRYATEYKIIDNEEQQAGSGDYFVFRERRRFGLHVLSWCIDGNQPDSRAA